MAKTKANMLEAFKASADETRRASLGDSARGGFGRDRFAGGPGSRLLAGLRSLRPGGDPAQGAAHPGGGSAEARDGAPAGAETGLVLPMGAAPFLLLQAVMVGAVFLAGRLSVGNVEAGAGTGGSAGAGGAAVELERPTHVRRARPAGSTPRESARPTSVDGPAHDPLARAAAVSGGTRTPADEAFLAAQNRFSVVVATYHDTTFGRERAADAYAHLSSLGFPVVAPRSRNGRLFLLVGAAPTEAELDTLEGQVQSVPAARGRTLPFESAYRVNIEDFL